MLSSSDNMTSSLFHSVILAQATAGIRGITNETKGALITSGFILLVALFLGLWQWFDRRSREPEPSDEDREFFRRQDRRRYVGVAAMVALAAALPFASFILTWLPAATVSFREKKIFAALTAMLAWVPVIALIGFLLVLAFFDGIATRNFARRHRRALETERSKLLLEVMHRSNASVSGRRSSGTKPDQGSSSIDSLQQS